MKGLTVKQRNIVDFIDEFMKKTEMAPTVYEIAEHFHIKTSTVFAHIKALQKKGILTRSSKARSISLVRSKRKKRLPLGVHAIPVLEISEGSASASAVKPQSGEFYCDKKLLGKESNPRNLFAVHVHGGAMRNLGILDGDIVILKSNPDSISRGDIVLTDLNGKPVLRSCFPLDAEHVELRPGNAEYQTMTCKKSDCNMRGVVIGLQRSMWNL